jgi:hypothetical protein
LPSAVRMATQKNGSAFSLSHKRDCSPQAVAVPGCAAGPRWPGGAFGAKWQIKTQHRETSRGKSVRHFDQQLRLAVCAGAVCQDNCAAARLRRRVQEAANRRVGNEINKRRKHRVCKIEKSQSEAAVRRTNSRNRSSAQNRNDGGGGGSRTPVRKALRTEAYMLISIRCATRPLRADRAFAGGAWNEQDAQPASPMVLARTLRTERPGPAHCVTPLTGPMSEARGSVRLIN